MRKMTKRIMAFILTLAMVFTTAFADMSLVAKADELNANASGLADGTYVIFNPASGKAMSVDATGTYYRAAVDKTLNESGSFDTIEDSLKWTVSNNADGTVTISCKEGVLSVSNDQTSANFDEANQNKTWKLIDAGNGNYYVKSATKAAGQYGEYYLEYYSKYTEFTTYSTSAEKLGGAFAFSFVAVAEDTDDSNSDEKSEEEEVTYKTAYVWKKADLADITSEDKVAITMTTSDGTTYVLPSATYTSGAIAAVKATVAEDELTVDGENDAYAFNIANADGTLTISNSEGGVLYTTATNNGVRIGKQTSFTWTLDSNGYLAGVDSKSATRYLGVYLTNPDWRAYTSVTGTSNIKDQTLKFFKLTETKVVDDGTGSEDEKTEDEKPEEEKPEDKPQTSDTVADGTYVIYNPANKLAMSSTTIASYYRAAIPMELNDKGAFDKVEDTEKWTVKNNDDGTVTISCAAGVLSTSKANASANFEAANEYTTWKLVSAGDGLFYVLSTKEANQYGNFYLEYYNNTKNNAKEFTTYATAESKLGPAFAMQFVPVEASAVVPEDKPENSDVNGRYVIYNAANKMALSSVYAGNYNSGVELTLNAAGSFDKVKATEVWTFTKNDNGSYTISQDGKKLSMDTQYSSMPLDKANDTWELVKLADGTYNIKNVGRGNYMEWYAEKNNFSSFYKITDATASLFAMTLVPVTDAMIEGTEVKPEDKPATSATIEEGLHYIYSDSAKGVLKYGITAGCASNVPATLENGEITNHSALSGAAVFDVKFDEAKQAYTFVCGGKYLAANSAEELYLADALVDTASNCTYWTVETNDKFAGLAIKSKSVKYNNNDVYMEYYSSKGFCLYTAKAFSEIYFFEFPKAETTADENNDGYAYGEVPKALPLPQAGQTVVIHNASGKQVIGSMIQGIDGNESKMGAVDAVVDENNEITVSNGGLIFKVGNDVTLDFTGAAQFEVAKTSDGLYTFACDGKYLTAGLTSANKNTLTLEATATDNSKWQLEARDGQYVMVCPSLVYYNKPQAIEFYSTFTTYGYTSTSAIKDYGMQFYDENGEVVSKLNGGEKVYIVNPASNSAMTANANTSNRLKPVVVGGGNGYYYFENNGQYLATNNDEELLVQDELNDMAKWELVEVLGGYLLKSKAAAWTSASGNSYPIYIEYFSGAFAGYSYKATSSEIFTFNFYEVEDKYNTGKVINPAVKFNNEAPANWDVPYTMNFTLDDLGTIKNTSAVVTFEDGTKINCDTELKNYDGKLTIAGSALKGHTSMDITVKATSNEADGVVVDFEGTKTIEIKDEPVITAVSPAPNTQTGDDKQPVVTVEFANAGSGAAYEMTVNDKKVTVKAEASKFTYKPASDLEDGKYTIVATITRKDGKVATKTWSFNVGKTGAALYFGQIHSHTAEYSDGSGTLEQAYEYAMNKAADTDYMIVTDHSNYFDTTSSATMDSIYDDGAASLLASSTKDANGKTLNKWQEAKATAAEYDNKSKDFIAAYGYEMTWSGGPGHINVFNTKGIVSRNNTTLNNKANNSGMLAFYDLLVDAQGKEAVASDSQFISAQFNHPGTTFGYFDSFTGWNTDRDAIMNLIEVGNGDGRIGGTAYFPSYEYYDMALTNGWHIAPTNGQDNHKGAWGDSNTARTVAVTDNFTEAGLYDAMNGRHIYSTEDQNLEMYYYLNDSYLMGSIVDNYDSDKVTLNVSLNDGDAEDLGTLNVIGLNGKVLYTSEYLAGNTADLKIELENTSPYYYVKLVQKDKDIAVSAPIWVASVVGESKVAATIDVADGQTPVQGAMVPVNANLVNEEDAAINVISYSVSVDDTVVDSKTLDKPYALKSGNAYKVTYNWTPAMYGTKKIKVAFVYKDAAGNTNTKTASYNVYVKGSDYDTVKTIAEAKNGIEKAEFTVEGIVTANTSGYDKNTAFFDCTYIQDATGGINIFPVSDSLQVGQKVRVHGAITYYNGEIELNLSPDFGGYLTVLESEQTAVEPKIVTASEAMADANIGTLMTVSGKVTRIHEAEGVVDRIYVEDESGVACVYINGYIWNSAKEDYTFGTEGMIPEVGDEVTVVGIGSVDVDELGEVEYLHRLRVRDRAEINVVSNKTYNKVENEVEPTCTKSGSYDVVTYNSKNEEVAREHKTVPALGHLEAEFKFAKAASTSSDGAYTKTCDRCHEVYETKPIKRIGSIVLDEYHFVYDGTAHKPVVKVNDVYGVILKEGKDYTVAYSGEGIEKGSYTVTVTFINDYTGKDTKVYYVESPVVKQVMNVVVPVVEKVASTIRSIFGKIFGRK